LRRGTFFILCLEGAILSFNVAATAALIPSIANDFGISQIMAGRAVWLYMLPYGIAALFYGPLVRIFDAKKVEVLCLFLFSLANLWAGLSRNITSFLAARFLMGVFGASVIPLALILIARHIDEKNRGRLVGIFFSITFLASLLGLFLSGIIPWRFIFLAPAISGFLLCVLMAVALPSFKEDKAAITVRYGAALKNKAIIYLFSYIFFISLLYHGIQQWLAVYFSARFSFNQLVISMLITLTSASGIIGELGGGWFADVIGRIKTAELGASLMVLSVFLLTLKLNLFILALIMIIWGLGWTFNHAGVSTLLTDLPREFLNEAASLNSSVRFIAGGLGVALGGVFIQKGLNLNFLILGWGLILLAAYTKKILILK